MLELQGLSKQYDDLKGLDDCSFRAVPGRPRRAVTRSDPLRAHGARDVLRHHDGMVGEGGVEPPRPYGHTDLNRARLPFRHSPE